MTSPSIHIHNLYSKSRVVHPDSLPDPVSSLLPFGGWFLHAC
jgi:hypothetical protein